MALRLADEEVYVFLRASLARTAPGFYTRLAGSRPGACVHARVIEY